jgi:hypothetical protein
MGKTKFLEWLIRAQYREHSQSTISRFGTGSDLDAVIDAAKEDAPSENNSLIKSWG